MTTTFSESLKDLSLKQIYPYAAIRVARIARDTDRKIADFQLTAQAAQELDQDNVGVLIANCGPPDQIHRKILRLAETEYPAPWVVVIDTIELTRSWYATQHDISTQQIGASSAAHSYWRTGNCWFTRLEQLEALVRAESFHGPIAGIILVDPQFRTQHARGVRNSQWSHNDRPELMNAFRAELAEDGLRPPLHIIDVERELGLEPRRQFEAMPRLPAVPFHHRRMKLQCGGRTPDRSHHGKEKLA